MKRTLFIIAVMMMTVTALAQQKVAILETVDKNQNISYGVKLLLRSSLTTAISETPGFEGYDRVDLASIAGEQEFQRTGNVSDSQIKQLGIATGASLVLVAEAAQYDEKTLIITAKILDVETFGIKSSAVETSGCSPVDMKKACANLARRLLTPTADPSNPVVSEPTATARPTESEKPNKIITEKPTVNTTSYTNIKPIAQKRRNKFTLNAGAILGEKTTGYYSYYYDDDYYKESLMIFYVGIDYDLYLGQSNFCITPGIGLYFGDEFDILCRFLGKWNKYFTENFFTGLFAGPVTNVTEFGFDFILGRPNRI